MVDQKRIYIMETSEKEETRIAVEDKAPSGYIANLKLQKKEARM